MYDFKYTTHMYPWQNFRQKIKVNAGCFVVCPQILPLLVIIKFSTIASNNDWRQTEPVTTNSSCSQLQKRNFYNANNFKLDDNHSH